MIAHEHAMHQTAIDVAATNDKEHRTMRRFFIGFLIIAAILVGGSAVASVAYQVGLSTAITTVAQTAPEGSIVTPVVPGGYPGYGYGYGHGWGWGGPGAGIFGLLGTLLVLFLVIALLRAAFFRGGRRGWGGGPGGGPGHWGGPGGWGRPDTGGGSPWERYAHDRFQTWHRESHEGPGQTGSGGATGSTGATPTDLGGTPGPTGPTDRGA
jgi:hypothetical protein